MAAAKRSKAEREHDLAVMAELLAQGATQRELAERFELSPGTIVRDVREIETRWRDRAHEAVESWKGRLLAGHAQVIRSAWFEFERSKSDAQKMVETTEMVKPTTPPAPNPHDLAGGIDPPFVEPQVLEVTRRVTTVEGQTGDPRYLVVIEGALTEQARLLGANSPERKELSGPNGTALPVQVIEIIAPIAIGEES